MQGQGFSTKKNICYGKIQYLVLAYTSELFSGKMRDTRYLQDD
jgi:hypothetical protein